MFEEQISTVFADWTLTARVVLAQYCRLRAYKHKRLRKWSLSPIRESFYPTQIWCCMVWSHNLAALGFVRVVPISLMAEYSHHVTKVPLMH